MFIHSETVDIWLSTRAFNFIYNLCFLIHLFYHTLV